MHRNSTIGDHVAGFLYEDLYDLNRSPKLVQRISSKTHVLNKKNTTVGKAARRGDGSFGEGVPADTPIQTSGLSVGLGQVALIEVGIEVKILAKAMIKQIDRVCTDMRNQAAEFRRHSSKAICVGIVGVNHSSKYTGYEGDKEWPTDGRKHKHPIQEAANAERHLREKVAPFFDETLILRFRASNVKPYDFTWVSQEDTMSEYSAALIRISREYEERF